MLLPRLTYCSPRNFTLITRFALLAPATLAALPSTRAIETRSLPSSFAATHRGFAFYVAFPKRSIPSFATCSMSLIPSAPFNLGGCKKRSNLGKMLRARAR